MYCLICIVPNDIAKSYNFVVILKNYNFKSYKVYNFALSLIDKVKTGI